MSVNAMPEEFRCPLTGALMVDPVYAKDGNTYSKKAIQDYVAALKAQNLPIKSPLTGDPMGVDLIPNLQLKQQIETFKKSLAAALPHPGGPRGSLVNTPKAPSEPGSGTTAIPTAHLAMLKPPPSMGVGSLSSPLVPMSPVAPSAASANGNGAAAASVEPPSTPVPIQPPVFGGTPPTPLPPGPNSSPAELLKHIETLSAQLQTTKELLAEAQARVEVARSDIDLKDHALHTARETLQQSELTIRELRKDLKDEAIQREQLEATIRQKDAKERQLQTKLLAAQTGGDSGAAEGAAADPAPKIAPASTGAVRNVASVFEAKGAQTAAQIAAAEAAAAKTRAAGEAAAAVAAANELARKYRAADLVKLMSSLTPDQMDATVKPELVALVRLEVSIAAHAQIGAANRIGAIYHRHRGRKHLKAVAGPSAGAGAGANGSAVVPSSKYSAAQSLAEHRETKQKLQSLKEKSGSDLEQRIATLTNAIRNNPKDRDNHKRMLELEKMQDEYDKYAATLTAHIDKLAKQRSEKRAVVESHAKRTASFRKALNGHSDRLLSQYQEREQLIERLLVVAKRLTAARVLAQGDQAAAVNESEIDRRIREWEKERTAAAAAAGPNTTSGGAAAASAAGAPAGVVATINVPVSLVNNNSAEGATPSSAPVAFQFVAADKLSGPVPVAPPGLITPDTPSSAAPVAPTPAPAPVQAPVQPQPQPQPVQPQVVAQPKPVQQPVQPPAPQQAPVALAAAPILPAVNNVPIPAALAASNVARPSIVQQQPVSLQPQYPQQQQPVPLYAQPQAQPQPQQQLQLQQAQLLAQQQAQQQQVAALQQQQAYLQQQAAAAAAAAAAQQSVAPGLARIPSVPQYPGGLPPNGGAIFPNMQPPYGGQLPPSYPGGMPPPLTPQLSMLAQQQAAAQAQQLQQLQQLQATQQAQLAALQAQQQVQAQAAALALLQQQQAQAQKDAAAARAQIASLTAANNTPRAVFTPAKPGTAPQAAAQTPATPVKPATAAAAPAQPVASATPKSSQQLKALAAAAAPAPAPATDMIMSVELKLDAVCRQLPKRSSLMPKYGALVVCLGNLFLAQSDAETYAADIHFKNSITVRFTSDQSKQHMIFRLCTKQLKFTGPRPTSKEDLAAQTALFTNEQIACVGFCIADLKLTNAATGVLNLPFSILPKPGDPPAPTDPKLAPLLALRYSVKREPVAQPFASQTAAAAAPATPRK